MTTVLDYILARIEVSPSGCWLWTGVVLNTGYGQVAINGVRTSAHRASFAERFGPIPKGMWVLHKCDIRSCCNPDHLFLGNHEDNMKDKVNKGRQARFPGSTHPMSKLS